MTVISFWRNGSGHLNALEHAGLRIHKTKQFSKQQHSNCLRVMRVRVEMLVYCFRTWNHTTKSWYDMVVLQGTRTCWLYWSTVLWPDGLMPENNNSTRRKHEPFFHENHYKIVTQDSLFILLWTPTSRIGAKKVRVKVVLVYCFWFWNHTTKSSYYKGCPTRMCWYWSTVL